MATRTTVILEDDIEGGEADYSINFALDGVTYEIDLNEKNYSGLQAAMMPWVAHARRTGGRRANNNANRGPAVVPTRSVAGPAGDFNSKRDRGALTAWALKNNRTPPADRGRVSAQLIQDWIDAGRPTD